MLRSLFQPETSDPELGQSIARKVILTTSATYFIWHMVATLGWPRIFSPGLWLCTFSFGVVTLLSVWLLNRYLLLAQWFWLGGLAAILLLTHHLYQRPEIIFGLAFLPIMALVMLGLRGAFWVEALLLGLALGWNHCAWLLPLPEGYSLALAFTSLAVLSVGWGLSDNLVSALEAASYHYREALKNLEDARRHRGEISLLLQEQHKANYQLDRLNQMLNHARARAEEAREERERFAMAASHELRSPLNFIIGFSDLMVHSPQTYAPLANWPEGLYDDVQEIYRSSTHLHSLIDDILDMGKMDARQMVLFRQKADIAEIIEEVRAMTEAAIAKKGLALWVEIQPDLPVLYMDRTRIRQVLINLLTNAVNFTPAGHVILRAFRKGHNWIQVEVEDSGTGIAEDDLATIFNEFRQAGQQNWRREEGSGLGLSIGRRFIQLHGGEMNARSQPGKGSTFWFTLPIRQDNVEELALASNAPLVTWRMVERIPLLLFLSANSFWARVFGDALANFKVVLIHDPAQLEGMVRQLYPRAVIIDRPYLENEHVRALIHNIPEDLAVMAFDIPVNLNQVTALPPGVVQYLVKPVARQTLVKAIQDLGTQVQRILVVDDDPGMLRFIAQTFKAIENDPAAASGYTFLTAQSGSEALNLLRSTLVHALLLDLDLPDLNGINLLEQMQQTPELKNIPVIILSANDLPQSLLTCRGGHFEAWINRPFQRQELLELLAAITTKSGL